MISSGYDLGWSLGFELGFPVIMVIGELVGYQLEDSISVLIFLALGTYCGTWEVYLVIVSLGTLYVLIIGAVEGYLVGLTLVLTLGSPLESPNTIAVIGYLFVSLT